ncbi:amino acid ABC transporter ATP-binding protein [Paraburkholderia sp. UYCP14C]|uniref:amino acid ABC transporter ATP-binding protein n=1 Tax=Paraburkholderia sp. UYCP14C TaxID=2511130 RepID=UPI001021B4AB|nr:amino acid ABC transporter ATP-binding protein [Paraburkholderia sp. UYCP14C]RZF23931.1 amino acid ABC transporter ATP-binding protein [Paraburkholderia sp. UYCP14C]
MVNSTQDIPVLEARGITKAYGSMTALKGVDLAARRGEVIALIGPSGSGKSTLLRCLNFLEKPSGGQVILDGADVFEARDFATRHGRREKARLIALRRRVGMVFQSFNLWPHRTALGNVMEGLTQVLDVSRHDAHDRAMQLLEKVGLAERASHYPSELSGGQQQRVGIARALATEPEILLFDEPTSALDPELVGEVLAVIQNLAKEGRTMVVVTHEIGFARDVASEVVFMMAGSVVEHGTPTEVLRNSRSDALRGFLGRFRQDEAHQRTHSEDR